MSEHNDAPRLPARPRIGYVGWGPESAAIQRLLGAQHPGLAAQASLFGPVAGEQAEPPPRRVLPTVEALFAEAELIFVAPPPAQVEPHLPLMRLAVSDRHVLVLLGHGWSLDTVLSHLHERKVMRCVVASLGGGHDTMAYCPSAHMGTDEEAAFRSLFGAVEHLLPLDNEAQFEVVLGLSAVTPAAFYTIVDAMADGAVAAGLSRTTALRFLAAVLRGAADAVLTGEVAPGVMRDRALETDVAAAGLLELESAGVRGLMMRVVREVMRHTRHRSPPANPEQE